MYTVPAFNAVTLPLLSTVAMFSSLVIGAIIFFGVYALILWIIDYKEFTQTVEEFTKGKIRRRKEA